MTDEWTKLPEMADDRCGYRLDTIAKLREWQSEIAAYRDILNCDSISEQRVIDDLNGVWADLDRIVVRLLEEIVNGGCQP